MLYYPAAKYWMWSYCVHLGPFTCPDSGKHYDLGVYVHPDGKLSAAIVYDNEPGSYMSGEESPEWEEPCYTEAFRRAHAAGF